MIDYWPFIMAGGGGTRFWPKSRQTCPKQFLAIVGEQPMITQTVNRLETSCETERIFIITNEKQADGTKSLVPQLPSNNIIAEPVGRNTAPCVGIAAAYAKKKSNANPVVGIFSADHVISPDEEFNRTISCAAKLAEEDGAIVTIGIKPSFPATGYGYIEHGDKIPEASPDAFQVKRFTEKPDASTAESFLKDGGYSWNAGIFFFKADTVLAELEKEQPEIFSRVQEFSQSIGTDKEIEALEKAYTQMPAISFDYAVMESAKNVKVVQASFNWDDVGSWAAVDRHFEKDPGENIFKGDVLSIDTKNVTVDNKRTVALIGVSDLIVVDTDDAILICDKNRAEDVKKIVEELKKNNRKELL